MQLKQRLQNDDSAVSPVIGVILMVAITVILAAVIASFVLGLGPDTATTPSASFSSDFDDGTDTLTITMNSGDTIDGEQVDLTVVDGTGASSGDDGSNWASLASDSEITAGKSIDVNTGASDYTVTLVYVDGDTTSTMQTFES